jgi:hypothetical protein
MEGTNQQTEVKNHSSSQKNKLEEKNDKLRVKIQKHKEKITKYEKLLKEEKVKLKQAEESLTKNQYVDILAMIQKGGLTPEKALKVLEKATETKQEGLRNENN